MEKYNLRKGKTMCCYVDNEEEETMRKRIAVVILFLSIIVNYGQALGQMPQTPFKVETKNLLVSVDPTVCRWSAEVKGTEMRLNDVYFLPGDDPSGWTVAGSVNNNDTNKL